MTQSEQKNLSNTLYSQLVQSLEIDDVVAAAKASWQPGGALYDKLAEALYLGGNIFEEIQELDLGGTVTSSLEDPKSFMLLTDALVDQLNAYGTFDDIPAELQSLASALLEVELVSLDAIMPDLSIRQSANVGLYELGIQQFGLTFSVFKSSAQLDPEMDYVDVLEDEHYETEFAGRIALYENGDWHWSEYQESNEEDEDGNLGIDESIGDMAATSQESSAEQTAYSQGQE